MGQAVTAAAGYHDVHLPEDPSRAVVWRAIAEHLPAVGPVVTRTCWRSAPDTAAGSTPSQAARRVAVDVWPEIARHAGAGVEACVLDLADRSRAALRTAASTSCCVERARALRAGCGRRLDGRGRPRAASWRAADRRCSRTSATPTASTSTTTPTGPSSRTCRSRICCDRSGLGVERRASRASCPYSMRGSRVPVPSWLVRAYLQSPIKPKAGPDARRGAERAERRSYARRRRPSASCFPPTTKSSTSGPRSRTS